MTAVVGGEWRVVGRSDDRGELLVRSCGGDTMHFVRVGTEQYGGDLQRTVDELRPGARIDATVYPDQSDRPGRFVAVDPIDQVPLSTGRVRRVPALAAPLWSRAKSRAGGEPVAASEPLETPDGYAELHVVERAAAEGGWLAFQFGGGLESLLDSFDHADGEPGEVVALDPVDRPYFVVFTFASDRTETAAQLRERAFAPLGRDETVAAVEVAIADSGLQADVR